MFKRAQWEEINYTISKNKLRTALSGFTIALEFSFCCFVWFWE